MSKVTTGRGKGKKVDRRLTGEKKIISLDTDPQAVAQWDLDGIIFEYDFDNFLELPDKVVAALGHANTASYFISKTIADKLKEQEKEREEGVRRGKDEPRISAGKETSSLNLIGGTATSRTEVSGGRPNTHYCLKLPEQISEALDAGYSLVDASDPVKTPGMTKVGGSRRISRHGEDELVLLKIPEERYQEHIHAVSALSKGARESVRDGFKKEGAKLKKTYHLEFSDDTRLVGN